MINKLINDIKNLLPGKNWETSGGNHWITSFITTDAIPYAVHMYPSKDNKYVVIGICEKNTNTYLYEDVLLTEYNGSEESMNLIKEKFEMFN